MDSWDYAHCLPYFKRMETCLAAELGDPFRGHSGPLVLERGPATSPLFGAFFQAVQEAGYPLTEDVNGYRQEGFAPFDRNVHRGRRLSVARAYLHPVMSRPNLEVKTRAFVSRVVFEGSRAVGVEFTQGSKGAPQRVRAGEVILWGGAINSPQIDLRSLRARQVSDEDFARYDLILAMDRLNHLTLLDRSPEAYHERIRLFMEFARRPDVEDVPDPYYGGPLGFEQVLDLAEEAAAGLLDEVMERVQPRRRR